MDNDNIKKSKGYYLVSVLGMIALFIFALTCIRPVKALGFDNGILPFILDGTIQHKVGELFLWIPLFFIGLSTFYKSKKEILQMIDKSKYWMAAGGILNLVAWFNLKGKVIWHLWCLVVFLWGFFAVPLSKKWFLPLVKSKKADL